MNTEAIGAYNPHREAETPILALQSLLQQLNLQGRSAIIVDASGSLLERQLRAAGVRVRRYASRTLIEKHGFWLEPWLQPTRLAASLISPDTQPAVLGSHPATLEYSQPLGAGLSGNAMAAVALKVETLAAAIDSSHRVGILALNDAHALKALANTAKACLHDQPALWFSPAQLNRVLLGPLLVELQELGYRLYNDKLVQLTPDEMGAEDALQCIALHASHGEPMSQQQLCALVSNPEHDSIERAFQQKKLYDHLPANAHNLYLQLTEGKLALPLDCLNTHNWYQPEYDGDHYWRWMGPDCEARLLIPLPGQGRYLLQIKIGWVAEDHAASLGQVFVNGIPVELPRSGLLAGSELNIPLDALFDAQSGWAELLFALPYCVQPNPDDPRKLGISIDSIELRWKGAR